MEAHGCNPSPWKAEARESPQIQGQPELQWESQDSLGYIMWDFISEQEKMRVKLLIAQNVSFPFLFDVYVCVVCTHRLLHVCMCVGTWVHVHVCVHSVDVICPPPLLPTLFIKGLSLNLELSNFSLSNQGCFLCFLSAGITESSMFAWLLRGFWRSECPASSLGT